MRTVEGAISDVIFTNEQNGYAVVELTCGSGDVLTVAGNIPFPGIAETLRAEGDFVTTASYGQQFKAVKVERSEPTGATDICRFLSCGVVKGVGFAMARRMVDRFGKETLEVLRREPERLTEIKGITSKKADEMRREYLHSYCVREISEFVEMNGFEPESVMILFRIFGADAVDRVMENPYLLVNRGITKNFAAADKLGLAGDYRLDSAERVVAAIVTALSEAADNGNVCLPVGELCRRTASFARISVGAVAEKLGEAERSGLVKLDVRAPRALCDRPCYLTRLYEAETSAAERVREMAMTRPEAPENVEKLIKSVASAQSLTFGEGQLEALRMAATESVMVLTGGPGTGKTTAARGIIELWRELGLKIALAAPTGKAAKRLSELAGAEAKTIHRLLEPTMDEHGELAFSRKNDNKLSCDALIVDEMSMVDIELFASLMAACGDGMRVVFVGDADQLPPVGAGGVLSDLLESGTVPSVRLTEIFRQAERSFIVTGAHAVNRGEYPSTGGRDGDLFIMQRFGAEEVEETVVSLVRERLPKNMGFAPGDIQVLAPNRNGSGGTIELNRALQAALNPKAFGRSEKAYGSVTFREGDRVMQISNNYDMLWRRENDISDTGNGIFNGDTGEILSIQQRSESITVKFDDKIAVYGFDELNQLELCYATTVHKAQGSEYPAVVLSLGLRRSRLLTRRLLYTAMTRAEKLLVIVGNPDTLQAMVQNNARELRCGDLVRRLRGEPESDATLEDVIEACGNAGDDADF